MAKEPAKQTKVSHSYKETLNLPYTEFPIRSNAKHDDPAMIDRWKSEGLYTQTARAKKGDAVFILHDGPPYANGNIHIGHAYNKIIKDIIAKSRRMQGMFVPVVLGFDCHGLPIELKVAETVNREDVGTLAFIKACREYASYWIKKQSSGFERLGVLMEWGKPYRTMDPSYESSTIEAFELLRKKGYITRHNKTVPWCSSCQTVLAQAEIEYQDRKDPSIFVAFPIIDTSAIRVNSLNEPVHVVIWTTTPWTIPLNRAVLVHPEGHYRFLRGNDGLYLVADSTAQDLADLFTMQLTDHTVSGTQLLQHSLQLQHPLIDTVHVPLIASEDIDLKDGTAFVHCAPGCGPEDYNVGILHGLEIYSPVAPDGTYTQEVIPEQLRGMSVSDGQIWVIKELAERSKLVAKKTLRHAYPHCWRCRNGLIFRATKQWFCDLSQHNLKQRVMESLEDVMPLPQASMNRLKSTIEGRLEWCISRQRVWGVPIPALLCELCDNTYTSHELSQFVAEQVAFDGIEFWYKTAVEMLPGAKKSCSDCGAIQWKKEGDILDVWFDAGISHYAVLQKRPELRFPADMYCEGKDQHRGWFQSSLLTSVIINGCAPFKTLLTHGFTVDKDGHKMSKSRGNVVSPQEMIEKLGTDGLRLWVASIDYVDDAIVSDTLLTNVTQVYRKIRNTCRFLLSNLHDFDISTDSVALERLQPLDQYALAQLRMRYTEIIAAYNRNDFTAVFHGLGDYCTSDLSSFYLDILKDRLYCDAKTGLSRRGAQTVCWQLLNTLTRLIAPILSFTAEHIWDYFKPHETRSIHLQSFVEPPDVWDEIYRKHHTHDRIAGTETPLSYERGGQWKKLLELRVATLKAIERMRETGEIKHSLEASLTFSFDLSKNTELIRVLRDYFENVSFEDIGIVSFLKQLCIVSQVRIEDTEPSVKPQAVVDGVSIVVEAAQGEKCPRCWHYTITNNQDNLCDRCMCVVHEIRM